MLRHKVRGTRIIVRFDCLQFLSRNNRVLRYNGYYVCKYAFFPNGFHCTLNRAKLFEDILDNWNLKKKTYDKNVTANY